MKALARVLATLLVQPLVWSLAARARVIGRDRAFQATSEALSLVPGLPGQYLRRAFLASTSAGCGAEAVVAFGAVFSSPLVKLDANAYVGPHCDIGWAHIERDVLVAAGVYIPSGPLTHGTSRLDVAIREQPGTPVCVHVREGAWIGNGAIVLADVGRHAIVAAGAVVTTPVPDFAVVAGVPARVVRDRRMAPETS